MVKYSKYFRRKYYKRKNFNKITKNYTQVTFDKSFKIIAQTGQFQFDTGANHILLGDILNDTVSYNKYRDLYSSIKIKSIFIEAVPQLRTTTFATSGTGVLGLLPENQGDLFQQITEASHSMILSYTDITRAYWYIPGGLNSWFGIENHDDIPTKLSTNTDSTPTAGQAFWSIKVSIRCLLKNKLD